MIILKRFICFILLMVLPCLAAGSCKDILSPKQDSMQVMIGELLIAKNLLEKYRVSGELNPQLIREIEKAILAKEKQLREMVGEFELNELIEQLSSVKLTNNSIDTVITPPIDTLTNKPSQASAYSLERSLSGFNSNVYYAEFSPDSTSVLGFAEGHIALLWSLSSDNEPMRLEGHTDQITAAHFSPDGRYVVTASKDQTARVWDTTTGKSIFTFTQHTNELLCVRFSPDGRHIVSGSSDNTVRVWDALSGEEKFIIDDHTDSVWDVAFSPNGKYLATASDDKTALLVDVSELSRTTDKKSYKVLQVLKGHTDYVRRVSFSDESGFLATGSTDRTAKLWQVTNDPRFLISFEEHGSTVSHLLFIPGDDLLVTTSWDGSARTWSYYNPKSHIVFPLHKGNINSADVNSEGKLILTAADDHQIIIWDPRTGMEEQIITIDPKSVYSAKFSPDGMKIVITSTKGNVFIWKKQFLSDMLNKSVGGDL